MIRGVIFDLDGVLVTTDDLHYQAWKRMADAEGVYFNREINDRLRGVSRMASLEIILELSTRLYTAEEKLALADRKNGYYKELLGTLSTANLLPGARETVAALRERGVKTAIASSSRNAPAILDKLGLTSLFDAIADGNDIRKSKPDPEVFLLAAERLGLPPAECLVIEDAVAGIEAGRRGGFHVFGIGSPESLPDVDRRAANLAAVGVDELLRVG